MFLSLYRSLFVCFIPVFIGELESKHSPPHLDPSLNLLQIKTKIRFTDNGPKFRLTIIELKFAIPRLDARMLPRHRNINNPDITSLIPSNFKYIFLCVRYNYEIFIALCIVIV